MPQQLKAGMSMILPVDFTGNPAPSATWSFRGVPLGLSGKYQINTSEYNTTLTVRDTEIDDSGTYTVTVTNRAGTASASFDINFKGLCACTAAITYPLLWGTILVVITLIWDVGHQTIAQTILPTVLQPFS